MKTYLIQWSKARKVGSIGSFSPGSVTIEAESTEQAIEKIYKTHEHFMGLRVLVKSLDSGWVKPVYVESTLIKR